jgi:hypothetical protein
MTNEKLIERVASHVLTSLNDQRISRNDLQFTISYRDHDDIDALSRVCVMRMNIVDECEYATIVLHYNDARDDDDFRIMHMTYEFDDNYLTLIDHTQSITQ